MPHTRLVSDWSSDVCSSDLFGPAKILSLPDALARTLAEHIGQVKPVSALPVVAGNGKKQIGDLCKECGQATFIYEEEIGRASGRKEGRVRGWMSQRSHDEYE